MTLQQAAALRYMNALLRETPQASYTNLAEHAAQELDHDEWLDNPEHWIWDMALSIGDPT